MPKALMDFLGYNIYFWSNEHSGNKLEPIHVHISKGSPSENGTKVWITQEGIVLDHNNGNIPDNELKKVLRYISINRSRIVDRWYKHFGM